MSKKLWQLLLQSALEAEEYEISCLECFDLLDQYADIIMEGVDPCEIMPAVRQHKNVVRMNAARNGQQTENSRS